MVPDRKGPPMTDAHVSLQDFRRRLRRHLPGGPDGGGAPWLDGLVMEHLPSGNVLRITFPHIYFARWFAPHETDFSAAVNAAWPDDVAPRLEYVLHGQPLPWRPAPQAAPFRIPDILFLHAGGSGDDAPLPGGARNAFPLALARAVVLREPGHSPFLLHGEKGTGKSHLLHHMAAALARQGLRVILAPAARFFRHCPPGEQTALLFWQQMPCSWTISRPWTGSPVPSACWRPCWRTAPTRPRRSWPWRAAPMCLERGSPAPPPVSGGCSPPS